MNGPAFPRVVRLANEEVRQRLHRLIDALPIGWVIRFSEATRTLAQNALLHALITEAVQRGIATDSGRRLTFDEAKVALVSAWMIDAGLGSDIVSFGGRPIQLRWSTKELTKEEFSSLVDFVRAECAQHGIPLRDAA